MVIVQEIWQNNWPRSTSIQVKQSSQMGNTSTSCYYVHICNLATMLAFTNEQIETLAIAQ